MQPCVLHLPQTHLDLIPMLYLVNTEVCNGMGLLNKLEKVKSNARKNVVVISLDVIHPFVKDWIASYTNAKLGDNTEVEEHPL